MRDLFQSLRIGDNQKRSANAQISANSNSAHLKVLTDKVERLSMMTVAALELLEEVGVSESRIAKKVEEIDLRDGNPDGKMTSPRVCGDCGNRVSPKRSTCFFCGSLVNQL